MSKICTHVHVTDVVYNSQENGIHLLHILKYLMWYLFSLGKLKVYNNIVHKSIYIFNSLCIQAYLPTHPIMEGDWVKPGILPMTRWKCCHLLGAWKTRDFKVPLCSPMFLSSFQFLFFTSTLYYRKYIFIMGASSGARTTYFSGVPEWSRNYLLLWSTGVEQELPTSLEYRSGAGTTYFSGVPECITGY